VVSLRHAVGARRVVGRLEDVEHQAFEGAVVAAVAVPAEVDVALQLLLGSVV